MRAAVALLFACSSASAQLADTSAAGVEKFTARARVATERFKDVNTAVAESYVKVGPDFPAMGEHWVNGELIMRGELDPSRPAILTYTTIAGRPTLTGIVYALALKRGETPPMLPRGAGWHDHVGSIDEESLLFGHDHHSDDDIRLVVMHAWIWQRNPAGIFATDNWALPFARMGLSAPSTPRQDAARALALLAGSASYFSRLFAAVGDLDDAGIGNVDAVLERQRSALEQWWNARPNSAELASAELTQLDATWARLARDVQAAVGPAAARRLSRLWAPDH